jgi:hypothetical protein
MRRELVSWEQFRTLASGKLPLIEPQRTDKIRQRLSWKPALATRRFILKRI